MNAHEFDPDPPKWQFDTMSCIIGIIAACATVAIWGLLYAEYLMTR